MPVHLVTHPLVHDALIPLRDKHTGPDQFRRSAARISMLLAAEALRDVRTVDVVVDTPLAPAACRRLASDVVVVPVLRSGLGMLNAVLELVPHARVGHIGLQRDEETAVASKYYSKLPARLDRSCVLLVDPMLATGGSAIAAIEILKQAGASDLKLVCIVSTAVGLEAVERYHPDVTVYTPVVDGGLNERKFIVPGVGDFGDRLYGTW